MARLFIVEDNDAIREAVASYLKLDGHTLKEFPRLAGLEDAIRMQPPDLIILDVMLPDGNGFQFAKKLEKTPNIPILFLTARGSESDRITGFEVGADDYMVKPFSPKELCLRVKAILKRVQATTPGLPPTALFTLGADTLTLDQKSYRVFVNSQEVILTTAEWKILEYLTTHAGSVASRDRLLGVCLDYTADGSQRTIDTHIKNIRLKLQNPDWIKTLRGFGYRFEGNEEGKKT